MSIGHLNCLLLNVAGRAVAFCAPSEAEGKERVRGILGLKVSLVMAAFARIVVICDRPEDAVKGYNMSVRLE